MIHPREIISPAGRIQLRPERDLDEDFRFRLFCESRPPEFALMRLPAPTFEQLMRLQFKAQTTGYCDAFPHAQFDVIERDGEAIGRIIVDRPGSVIHIVDQALMPSQRNLGIGTAIMTALMDEARREALPLRLKVASSNDPSMRLYLRLGLVPIADDPMFVEMEWRAVGSLAQPGALTP